MKALKNIISRSGTAVLGGIALAAMLLTGIVGSESVMALEEDNCDPGVNCIPESWRRDGEGIETTAETDDTEDEIEPTFISDVDSDDESATLWMGKNLFLAGNNITSAVDASTGLMFVAGNNLNLSANAEYGFVAGNMISFSGATKRDLFAAGSVVTIEPGAKVGRNVFAAAAAVNLKADLPGDFAATAAEVVIKDAVIKGNVDLTADEIRFEGKVKVAGTLIYNDDAVVSGLNSNGVEVAKIETFHIEEISAGAKFAAEVYSKLFSAAGLFLAMALLCAVYGRLHKNISANVTPDGTGKSFAIGIGALIGIPAFILVMFCTVVATPLGLIALVIYCIMIYLSQGFAGVWLGNLIVVKLCKSKTNVYLEALIGIVILSALSLIPVVGVITGFAGLLLGLGLITTSLAPHKEIQDAQPAVAAKTTKKPAKAKKA